MLFQNCNSQVLQKSRMQSTFVERTENDQNGRSTGDCWLLLAPPVAAVAVIGVAAAMLQYCNIAIFDSGDCRDIQYGWLLECSASDGNATSQCCEKTQHQQQWLDLGFVICSRFNSKQSRLKASSLALIALLFTFFGLITA